MNRSFPIQETLVRGIEEFSHLWLIWEFSENVRDPKKWSPTVRPPRLGGNTRVGVFATEIFVSPEFTGLSVVRLKAVETGENGMPVLVVTGADMMDGTPVFDIKPYIPFADSHPEAKGGYTDQTKEYGLDVRIPEEFLTLLPEEKRARSAPSFPRIRVRPTRKIRHGSTGWNLPGMR